MRLLVLAICYFVILDIIDAQVYHVKNGNVELMAKTTLIGIEDNFYASGNGLNGTYDKTKASFSFTYDLWKLDTGIELRNEHMHENHLETESFPEAYFKGKVLNEKDNNLLAVGSFTIHGVTNEITIKGFLRNDSLFASWKLNLNDFAIDVPSKFYIAKLNETLEMSAKMKLVRQE